MFYILPIRFFSLVFLGVALLLSGCCANNRCDCNDGQADVVQLVFSNAFRTADLDTIIIQRSPLPFSPTAKPEIVTLTRTAARARDTLRLNNNSPFAQVGTTKLNRYRYVVQYLVQPPGSKPVATTALVIDSTRLRGSLDGNGCCTCYTNSDKTVFARANKKLASGALDSVIVQDLRPKPSTLRIPK